MKTRIFSVTVLILALILILAVSQSFAQNFPTYHPLGRAKSTLWRPTFWNAEHCNTCHASQQQLPQSGGLHSDERQGFCSTLHERTVR